MKKKSLLLNMIMIIFLCLITLFSVEVEAANFAYSNFDWDKFYEENKSYWTDYCDNYSKEMEEKDCLEIVLSSKKKFYVKLYKLLAKYERKGYKLDDNYILATVFYYLTPDTFTDVPEQYREDYLEGNSYNIDEEDNIDTYDIDSDEDADYWDNEKDSLKTLMKNMFAYNATCTGNVGEPFTDEDGNKVCANGTLKGDNCVGTIKTYKVDYGSSLSFKLGILGRLFGKKDLNREECEKDLKGEYSVDSEKEINYDMYWEFLKESDYFDKKIHFQSRFESILKATNHSKMTELSEEEYKEYNDKIIKIRERIIEEIKSVLKDYEPFMADTPDSFNSSCSGSAWWPIGSNEVTEENGVTFAKGNPSYTGINSPFGDRIHPITGQRKRHTGVDLQGDQNVTNVIAVKDGTVVYPTESDPTNCPSSNSLDSCGGGYGNYVVIQHNDGSYTLYGHMYANTVTVRAGDSVKQGQVIGKVGTSGNSTGAHLHFEVRQGTNSSSSAVDPMTIVSADNPRVSGGVCGTSDFLSFLHSWENSGGAPERNGNYVVHDDGAGIPTVGYGVALKYNIARFKAKGIDVSGIGMGDELPKNIVDAVEREEVNEAFNNIRNLLSKNGITIADYQIEALVSRYYNCGNINSFPSQYKQYGDTDALYDNYMNKPVTGEGVGYLDGLKRRREAEWQLFHYHNYQLNA